MLKAVGVDSLDQLIDETVPSQIRLKKSLKLDAAMTESEFLAHLSEVAKKNKVFRSLIGLGYYGVHMPSVIRRNILENPGWYTQYTPYQAEISQGRLEALMNFQTAIIDLTGMKIANASLLDEGTAAAEAMTMVFNLHKGAADEANEFLVDKSCFPQTIDVLMTRAAPFGINVKVLDYKEFELTDKVFGVLVQYPSSNGSVEDYTELFKQTKEKGIYNIVAADLLGLALLTPPGEFGADAVVGSAQRFGVTIGFGGPHAGYFATKDDYKRVMPGRIIGASIDSHGNLAYRMALQTREQHIRREKATSNICTAQVLLAIIAGMYAIHHGPEGIKSIAQKVNGFTAMLDAGLKKLKYKQVNKFYFDTLNVDLSASKALIKKIQKLALKAGINFRYEGTSVFITLDELTSATEVETILNIFAEANGSSKVKAKSLAGKAKSSLPENLVRQSAYLTHPVFKMYQSETEMMRYIKSLEKKDLSLTTSMIPLGSCTMKLNAAVEMLGITMAEFANMHPFVPEDQTEGYKEMFSALEKYLCEITGFAAVSLQPNSGAQGEYAGLMTIRQYHISKGDNNRNVVIIPSSAHGTNPASAVMAGMKVVVSPCDASGNVDLNDLRQKAEENKDNLAGLMITYPSTHGVFEESIIEICDIIHKNGGQVYMDGANMNAQVGLTSPASIGADVCHLNLHKTFTIPHGGGGPGVGPIAVAKHLAPFLPGHPLASNVGGKKAITAVASAPWGSAGILPIPYAYIKLMGAEGLTESTKYAILNANYIKAKLENYYKVLYVGKTGRVAHELIFDMREFKHTANIEVEDIAKRLMDYGYHAPTVSFPVPGTLMIEPTESESKAELDKFCEAMISIREEIREIENKNMDAVDNPLKNSPHTAAEVIKTDWNHAYSREKAVFPAKYVKDDKFWPSVGRINNAYGDRNLVCACPPIEDYK
jgi:glycine dehydrogenase